MSIAVEGPSKAEIDFQDRKDGSCGVTYNVAEPGNTFFYFCNMPDRAFGFILCLFLLQSAIQEFISPAYMGQGAELQTIGGNTTVELVPQRNGVSTSSKRK